MYNTLPARCWIGPDNAVHQLPLIDGVDVYSRWASMNTYKVYNLNGSKDLVLEMFSSGWFALNWHQVTCGKSFEEKAIDLIHSSGVYGKCYTIKVLMGQGNVEKIGSIVVGRKEKKPIWWEK